MVARKTPKTDVLQQKSPAEFFADNKNIAGFDNPGKCLYTTVREFVENSLDSSESIQVLPEIEISIEEMKQNELNVLRVLKEAKDQERLEKAGSQGRGDKLFYRVTVKDNGVGLEHSQIPDMLGRVLSGTKYGVAQTRGKFGLGAKMALIWSKMSTGLPITVRAARRGSASISFYRLDIDIQRNQPNVHEERLLPNPDRWHGAELSVVIEGNWQYYRSKILKYLQLVAVITPYCQTVKHHPASVDLELVKRLSGASTEGKLLSFLSKSFACVNRELAGRIVDEMQAGVTADTAPSELTLQQVARLHQLLHEVKFPDPTGDHLSPAGEYNLRLGIMKEFAPELVATHQGQPRVHDGHAFLVEAGVSIGGRAIKPGINIHRFANRIPLLFEGGSDVITRTALRRINWSQYKINQATDKVGVFVSIVSTKIPFKGAGKEYIADDVEEMQVAVKTAIQACCLQLRSKLVKQAAAKEQAQRKRVLTKYIPNVAAAVFTVLRDVAGRPPAKLARLDAPQRGVVAGVKEGAVTEKTLIQRLTEHIERIDMDMALEYQIQQGVTETQREEIFLRPLDAALHDYEPPQSNGAVSVQLLKPRLVDAAL
ncbi:hypothetical protein QBZ16_000175 [Prototheca wickerhamii]|uniref:DNA topoisomerase 6 subunit B n=1 Tax=Prototheca wickerhamii TaxID=3111 RepID=A0AAD9IPL4_PROWI|nr:hypothetical protein QBZ16_000175 [Prototheca wickerhamii]